MKFFLVIKIQDNPYQVFLLSFFKYTKYIFLNFFLRHKIIFARDRKETNVWLFKLYRLNPLKMFTYISKFDFVFNFLYVIEKWPYPYNKSLLTIYQKLKWASRVQNTTREMWFLMSFSVKIYLKLLWSILSNKVLVFI